MALHRCIPECATDEDTFHSVLRVARERERERERARKRGREGDRGREGERERERERERKTERETETEAKTERDSERERERERQRERKRERDVRSDGTCCFAMYCCLVLPMSAALQDTLVEYVKTRWSRGGGLGSRPKKMYGERLGDGVEYHLMKPTPRR